MPAKARLRIEAKGSAVGFGTLGTSFKKAVGWSVLLNQTLSILMRVGRGVNAVIEKTIGKFADFEHEMAQVNTLLDVSNEKFGDITEGILRIAKTTSKPISDLTKGMYDLRSAGVAVDDMQSSLNLTQKAAVAGNTSIKNSVNAAMATINAYGLAMSDLEAVLDLEFKTVKLGVLTYDQLASSIGKVLPVARAAGDNLYELHAALAVITKGGFNAAQASTALMAAYKELTSATKLANFKKMGIAVFDTEGKFRGLSKIVVDVRKHLEGMTDEQKVAWMDNLKLQGRSARAFLTLINNGEVYDETLKEIYNSAGAMSEAHAKMEKTLKETWGRLKNTVTATTLEWINSNDDFIRQLTAGLDATAKNIGLIINIVGGYVKYFGGVFKMVTNGVSLVVNAALTAIGFLATGFLSYIDLMLAPLAWLEEKLGLDIGIRKFKENVNKAADTMAEFTTDAAKRVGEDVKDINEGFNTAIDGFAQVVVNAGDLITNVSTAVKNTIEENNEAIKDSNDALLTDTVYTVEQIQSTWDKYKDIIEEVGNKMAKVASQDIGRMVSGLITGQRAFKNLKDWATKFTAQMAAMVAQAAAFAAIMSVLGLGTGGFMSIFRGALGVGGKSQGGKSQGGQVDYMQAGGQSFRRGRDLVPTMLTPGEIVISPEKAAPIRGAVSEVQKQGEDMTSRPDIVINMYGSGWTDMEERKFNQRVRKAIDETGFAVL